MVATGVLKFDIFEESDRTLLDYVATGDPVLDDLTQHQISRQLKLFQVYVDDKDYKQ